MRIKKVVFFTEPGERTRLDELATKYSDESRLALAIQETFKKDFSEAMTIAQIWLEVKTNPKN